MSMPKIKKPRRHDIEDVFDAIRGERKYQDSLWSQAETKGIHTVPEWLLFIRSYLREAEEISARRAAPEADVDSLHIMRKIAAMAICCMEQNGVYQRDMGDLKMSCPLHGVACEDGPITGYRGRKILLPGNNRSTVQRFDDRISFEAYLACDAEE
jgi:hypothetical protein